MKRNHLYQYALVFGIFLTAAMSGCYYDNLEELHPKIDSVKPACDSSGTITYNTHVKDFVTTYCGTNPGNSCHSSSSSSGWDLSTYQGCVDAASGNTMADALTGANGNNLMPKNGTQLDAACVKMIQKWTDAGTPN